MFQHYCQAKLYVFGALALQHCGLSWPWPWEQGWLAEGQQLKDLWGPAAAWHGGLPTRLRCAVPGALWPGSRPGRSSRSAPRRPLRGWGTAAPWGTNTRSQGSGLTLPCATQAARQHPRCFSAERRPSSVPQRGSSSAQTENLTRK